jgi:hypothetical protein
MEDATKDTIRGHLMETDQNYNHNEPVPIILYPSLHIIIMFTNPFTTISAINVTKVIATNSDGRTEFVWERQGVSE